MCASNKEILLLLYCWHSYNAYILGIKVGGKIRQVLTHMFRNPHPPLPSPSHPYNKKVRDANSSTLVEIFEKYHFYP